MPLLPNPYFVGRKEDLLYLARSVKAGGVVAVGQVIAATGLGGIGKTQLASEFAHRYGRYFAGGVFWIGFAAAEAIPAEIAGCGGAGGLDLRPDFGVLPLEDQLRLVLSAWQSPLPRLLVFDNCEDDALLRQWRPPTGNARVLLTSRRRSWDAELGVECLPLGVLSRAESLALLGRFRPDLPAADPDLAAIADELGDLPLALHLAGSYLRRYRHDAFGTAAAYRAELARPDLLQHVSLSGDGQTAGTQHESHVARTFALSYERLRPDDPRDALALALLARSAWFAPGEPMPRALLLGTVPPPDDPRAPSDALRRLEQLGLLDCEADAALRLHRLLAAFVRRVLPDAAAVGAVEDHLQNEAYRLVVAGYPAPLSAWQAHLQAVERDSRAASGLLDALGRHLRTIANHAGAKAACERALAIFIRFLGPEHPSTRTVATNLAAVNAASAVKAEPARRGRRGWFSRFFNPRR